MSQPDEGLHPTERPARYGPYHRLASPTQTHADALRQSESGEIWGRAARGSLWPRVEAYEGPLLDGCAGIEFYTDRPPDTGGRRIHRTWTAIVRPDIPTDGEFAKIPCVVTRIAPEATR